MPPPRNALINGVFDFWSKGATHVDICTNIQETLRILKEGATHVDICTNIQKTLRLSKKGNTQVDIISNALRTMGDGARSAGKETKRNQIIHSKKTKAAFTLAEVLITLGIIGVVAASSYHTRNYRGSRCTYFTEFDCELSKQSLCSTRKKSVFFNNSGNKNG